MSLSSTDDYYCRQGHWTYYLTGVSSIELNSKKKYFYVATMYNFRHLSHPKRVQLSSGSYRPQRLGARARLKAQWEDVATVGLPTKIF